MSQLHLLKARRFGPLFWTQFLGAFNDNFLKNALVILVTFKARAVMGLPSTEIVAISGGIFILPFFLFSATAGQLADKYDKASLIRIIKLAEIGIMALATAGLLLHQYEFLLAVLFLMGLHSTFFGPIKYSILPQHLRPTELVGGNALIEAGTFLSILFGTILGGVLIGIGEEGPLLVSAGLVAVAIGGYLASRGIPAAPPVDPSIEVQWNPVPPTARIYRIVREERSVFLSSWGISWFWFFGGALLSLFPGYCKDVLHSDQTLVTLFLAAFSVGIGAGSMLCERLSRRVLELGLVPLGSIGMTAFGIDLFFHAAPAFATGATAGAITAFRLVSEPGGLRILLDLVALSVSGGLYIVPLYTLLQSRSEPSLRSRIIAGNNILNAFLMVLSAVAILLMTHLGLSIPQMFLALALMNGAVALYIYWLLPEFLMRFLVWVVANIMYRMRVTGLENLPTEGPAIIVCNHVSFIDWLILAAGIPRPPRFVMDHSFFRGFPLKQLMMQAKVIPIASSKENPEVLAEAYRRIGEELANGQVVCLFPEGAITRDGALQEFRPGILRILAGNPVPVVPVALHGLWGSFFSREGGRAILKVPRRFWSRVELRVGAPVPPAEAGLEELRTRVQRLLQPVEM